MGAGLRRQEGGPKPGPSGGENPRKTACALAGWVVKRTLRDVLSKKGGGTPWSKSGGRGTGQTRPPPQDVREKPPPAFKGPKNQSQRDPSKPEPFSQSIQRPHYSPVAKARRPPKKTVRQKQRHPPNVRGGKNPGPSIEGGSFGGSQKKKKKPPKRKSVAVRTPRSLKDTGVHIRFRGGRAGGDFGKYVLPRPRNATKPRRNTRRASPIK